MNSTIRLPFYIKFTMLMVGLYLLISIPLVAIIKMIADHIKPLKPWGFLLGDSMPPILRFKTRA